MNAKEFKLGKLMGQDISATPAAIAGFVILWVVFAAIGALLIKLPLTSAIIGGLAAAVLHEIGEAWHQFGHAQAARSTGHPMTGIRFGFLLVLSTALYPANEPALPAAVHIRRALGARSPVY